MIPSSSGDFNLLLLISLAIVIKVIEVEGGGGAGAGGMGGASHHSHPFVSNHMNLNGGFGDQSYVGSSDSLFEDDSYSSSIGGGGIGGIGGVSMCLPNYDVSEGSIIRTKDSVELGARFLNETDLGSHPNGRDECLRLCCRTPYCNVAVFQEKSSGSCYMFDCGSVEDFRCKFTSQIHYMSAILRRKEQMQTHSSTSSSSNNHQQSNNNAHNNGAGAGNNNQHEDELSQLRSRNEDDKSVIKGGSLPLTLVNGGGGGGVAVTLTPPVTPAALGSFANTNSRRCSRWQFECKSSGECIAIYNACDGIPNCEDASDEGPELHCPSVLGQIASNQQQQQHLQQLNQHLALNPGQGQGAGESGKGLVGNHGGGGVQNPKEYPLQMQINPQQQLPLSVGVNTNKNEHIFNHKGAGIMHTGYGNQLQQQQQQKHLPFMKQGYPDYSAAGETIPNIGYGPNVNQGYSQQGANSPYGVNYNGGAMNYGYGPGSYGINSPLNIPPYGQGNQQLPQQYYNTNQQQQQNGLSVPVNKGQGQMIGAGPIFIPPIPQLGAETPKPLSPILIVTNAPTTISPSISNVKAVTIENKGLISKEQQDSEARLEDEILKNLKNQPYTDAESAAIHLEELSPHRAGSGAVFLFLVGLAMSIVMFIILGCRLRRIGGSGRRRRKNRLDPDYLVDGMYL